MAGGLAYKLETAWLANDTLERRRALASLRYKALLENDQVQSTTPDTAFLYLMNIALLLLNSIPDYLGKGYIHTEKMHRLLQFSNFKNTAC